MYLRVAIIAAGFALPALSLIPLGSVWLWQNGYVLYWAVAACITTGLAYFYQRWLLKMAAPQAAAGDAPKAAPEISETFADPGWSPREKAAWETVVRMAETAGPERLASRDAAIALGLATIESVARSLHPKVEDPLWQFTVPEALALIEQVSRRMRPMVIDNVPLGDQLTVAQVLKLYRWRGAVDVASRAYDLWRIIRFLNPVAAATQEVREQLTKQMYEWGKDRLARGLAQAYVQEVGRAAIDLYAGRLRVTAEQLEGHVSSASGRDRRDMAGRLSEPLRMLIAGQAGAGKSSLVNALIGQVRAPVDAIPVAAGFTAYDVSREGLPPALLIDTPGLTESEASRETLATAAADCDLVLWVVSAARPDREADRRAIERFRHMFDERPDRKRPPLICALTQVDRLRPFHEWRPPYDLADTTSEKAASIRAARESIAEDLGLAPLDIVPVALPEGRASYNLEAVWARVLDVLPEAQRALLLRNLSEIKSAGWSWGGVWRQAGNAGRAVLGRAVARKPHAP